MTTSNEIGAKRRAGSEGDIFAMVVTSYKRSLLAANMSRATIENYMSTLDWFRAFLRERNMPTDPSAVSREHIETFLNSILSGVSPLTGRPYAPSTALAHYIRLHSFFAWLVEMDEIKASPMSKIKAPRIPKVPPDAVSEEQVRKLLRKCEGKSFDARRDTAIFRVLIDTGMRLTELTNMRLADIDWEARSITVLGKGRKQRFCWFGGKSLKALDLYINWARPKHADAGNQAVWLGRQGPMTQSGIYQMVKVRGEAAGIENCHPHKFRHFAAYAHVKSGGTETNLMRRMGWSSRSIISRYTAGAADELSRAEYDRLQLGDKF